MESIEYERMHAVEDRMWWYRGLHGHLLRACGEAAPPGPRLLDAGCGTGGFLRRLAGRSELSPFGVEIEPGAARLARQKSGQPVTVGSIMDLPFTAAAFDLVVSADVLGSDRVDPHRATREAWRCLRSGGRLVLNLPAYDWLLSEHDRATHQSRRFTASRATQLLQEAGFIHVQARYWNCVLLPIMVLRRKVFPPPLGVSDVRLLPGILERLFLFILDSERALMRAGLRLPFGGSLLVTGAKP